MALARDARSLTVAALATSLACGRGEPVDPTPPAPTVPPLARVVLSLRDGVAGAASPANWWHNGSLPGTASFAARIAGGITVAAGFNSRAMMSDSAFESRIDPTPGQALSAVTSWPTHDLLARFP
jgi:hypothetical protein